MPRPKQTKILVGYSDITTLHFFVGSRWQWPTLHGPLLDRFGRGSNRPKETKEVFGFLSGRRSQVEFTNLKPMNKAARKSRSISGSVIGGNLTVLASGLGTPWEVHPKGHFVFLEDLGEKPHRLDRMLTQLTQSGFFKHCRALVFGDILLAEPNLRRLIFDDVLPRFSQAQKFPVLMGLPCGHGKVQRPLPFLTDAELQTGPRARLSVKAAR